MLDGSATNPGVEEGVELLASQPRIRVPEDGWVACSFAACRYVGGVSLHVQATFLGGGELHELPNLVNLGATPARNFQDASRIDV